MMNFVLLGPTAELCSGVLTPTARGVTSSHRIALWYLLGNTVEKKRNQTNHPKPNRCQTTKHHTEYPHTTNKTLKSYTHPRKTQQNTQNKPTNKNSNKRAPLCLPANGRESKRLRRLKWPREVGFHLYCHLAVGQFY